MMDQVATDIPVLVRVGVSGHRNLGGLAGAANLPGLVRETFRSLRERLREELGAVEFVLVSPLADGADRLVVDAIWQVEPEARLLVPLPFGREEYESSFCSDDSRAKFRDYVGSPACLECFEIPGGQNGRYFPVGKYVVDHSDVMFFVHDGSDPFDGELDGGTSSVLRYALAGVRWRGGPDESLPPAWNRSDPQSITADRHCSHLALCHIDAERAQVVVVRPERDGSEASSAEAESPRALLPGYPRRLATARDRDELERGLAELADGSFDRPAARYQRLFDRQSTQIVGLALAVSVVVLSDWFSGGNHVFAGLGPLRPYISWDSIAALGLVTVMLMVRRYRQVNHLGRWLRLRYLAERMRSAPTLARAGVPLSTVLAGTLTDPASPSLSRVWRSLYYRVFLAYRDLRVPGLSPAELRTWLLSSKSIVSDQWQWHRRRAQSLWRLAARQRRWRALFYLASLTTTLAAAGLVLVGRETPIAAGRLDYASSLLSLLLAATATLTELKENGKIASRYQLTCEQLSRVYREIEYLGDEGDGPCVEELRALASRTAEVLMQTTFEWMATMSDKDPDWA